MDQFYIEAFLNLKEFTGQYFPTDIIRFIMMIFYRVTKIKISCGWAHTSLFMNQKCYVWGSNGFGQLGLGHKDDQNSPQKFNSPKHLKSIKCSRRITIAQAIDNDCYICGDIIILYSIKTTPFKLPIQNIIRIQNNCSGNGFGLIARDKMYCTQSPFSDLLEYPILDVKQIKNCGTHIIIRTKLGKLYGSGHNGYGQLGLGCYDHYAEFKQIILGDMIKIDCGDSHSVSLSLDDKLFVWGRNLEGQLGLGDNENRNLPTQLQLQFALPVKSKIRSVCCGGFYTMILLEHNQLYVWGRNTTGELGLGHFMNMNRPQKLDLGDSIMRICAGNAHSVVTTSDGIYVWGSNYLGQLGLGDYVNRHIPTKLSISFLI